MSKIGKFWNWEIGKSLSREKPNSFVNSGYSRNLRIEEISQFPNPKIPKFSHVSQ
jgi:hypothetical protein